MQHRARWLASSIVAALLLASAAAGAPAPRSQERIDEHVLHLHLEPTTSQLEGRDLLTTTWRPSLTFRLHPELEITTLECAGQSLLGKVERGAAPEGTGSVTLPKSCADEAGFAHLEFAYRGRIHDPVEREQSLHFVTGDHTGGLISSEGVFLDGGSGHYPETGAMALFDVTVDVPAGWTAVSQGGKAEPAGAAPAGRSLVRFVSKVPADGLALSAGPYVVKSTQAGDTIVSTYLFEKDAALADALLPAAAAYIRRFETMLGPYPHPKFDIVENFFTTGYGFPSYTLLGQDVLRMGPRALRPGYLDHEIAHCWWGNHVYVDPSEGNWCEGLTSYVSNYRSVELDEGSDAAAEARRRISQRYSVDVRPDEDFAPSKFVTKADDAGSSIGYGKVSMVFHVLRSKLDDDTFWTALRRFAERFGGRRAKWSDIESVFEEVTHEELGPFFDQWIERAGLPSVRFANVALQGGEITGQIVQDSPPRDLVLPVRVTLADGRTTTTGVPTTGAVTDFRIGVEPGATKPMLDPDFTVPRRLASAELPPSLARTLAGAPTVVIPSTPPGADDATVAMNQALAALGATVVQEHGGRVVADTVTPASLADGSVLILGGPARNAVAASYAGAARAAGLDLGNDGSFGAGGTRWEGANRALLASFPHPLRIGSTVTVFVPNGPPAVERARFIFFYGWETWAALEDGRAKARHVAWPETPTSVVHFRTPESAGPLAAATTPGQRMLDLARRLSRDELGGRDAGTPGAALAVRELELEMLGLHLQPVLGQSLRHELAFRVLDLKDAPVLRRVLHGTTFYMGDGKSTWAPPPAQVPLYVRPSSAWLSATLAETREIDLEFPRGAVVVGDATPEGCSRLDLAGSLAVFGDRIASPPGSPTGRATIVDEAERWAELAKAAKARDATAVLILRRANTEPVGTAFTTFGASSLSDERTAKRAMQALAAGGERAVLRLASGAQARVEAAGATALPLFFAAARAPTELADAEPGTRIWDGQELSIHVDAVVKTISDVNLVGVLRGTAHSKNLLLLGAHHDGVGMAADGSTLQGAVDNASGVAVVLEVARRLKEKPIAADVAVVLYGAEEWGLRGSRALVEGWPADQPVRWAINVDSVGMAGHPLHVIGRTRETKLSRVIEKHAKQAGIALGADIDMYADRDGSDHWPWAQASVPSVNLFQADYKVLNTAADTIELLDAAALERLADALEAAVRELGG